MYVCIYIIYMYIYIYIYIYILEKKARQGGPAKSKKYKQINIEKTKFQKGPPGWARRTGKTKTMWKRRRPASSDKIHTRRALASLNTT